MTLILHVLPALHGDALCLEYGKNGSHRLLIDGGPRSKLTDNLISEVLSGHKSSVELVVVTHIDADHITGILRRFQDMDMPLEPRDVWFNGWRHLPNDLLGAEQGEAFSDAIEKRQLPWNLAFDGGPVSVPDQGPLPRFELPGDLSITLLSPTRVELAALRPVWKRELEKAGLVPGVPPKPTPKPDLLGEASMDLVELATRSFNPDHSQANAASIAFLAEHSGRSLLLTGDAHPGVLINQLQRLASERALIRLPIDVVKLPHHGSRRNISQDFVDAIDCERWIFSTNGAIFGHPDPEAVARVIVDRPGAELMFNYRTETTDRFDSPGLRRSYKHKTRYPQSESEPGLHIDLLT